MIIFVAAHDKNLGMGNKGGLPWPSMKADKDRLHKLAKGKTIVMGERTYHDYKDYQKTYKTKNIFVLSLNSKELKDAVVLNSIEQVVELAKNKEVWVLGGGNVFAQLIENADKMYITEIEAEFETDTYFPQYDTSHWKVVEKSSFAADALNPYPYTFMTLQKK